MSSLFFRHNIQTYFWAKHPGIKITSACLFLG